MKNLIIFLNRMILKFYYNNLKINKMIKSGEVAIIPIGFRCHTKDDIEKILNISQKTLPFDNGFFPPESIVSIINNPKVDLGSFDKKGSNHVVCVKYENYNDLDHVDKGIKFEKSSYEYINNKASIYKHLKYNFSNPVENEINRYIDSTFGYYTLDLKHNFILVHYNWHKFADLTNSKGIYDTDTILSNTNKIINRRIKRMLSMCNSARYIFFIYSSANDDYKYMLIDDQKFNLEDLSGIRKVVDKKFSAKSFVLNIKDLSSAKDIWDLIKNNPV